MLRGHDSDKGAQMQDKVLLEWHASHHASRRVDHGSLRGCRAYMGFGQEQRCQVMLCHGRSVRHAGNPYLHRNIVVLHLGRATLSRPDPESVIVEDHGWTRVAASANFIDVVLGSVCNVVVELGGNDGWKPVGYVGIEAACTKDAMSL